MDELELLSLATPVLARLNETPVQATFLAKGATCNVWKLRSTEQTYALRIIESKERVLDGEADAYIRASVLERGGRVVIPLLNSESTGHTLNGKRWCLEHFAKGSHPIRGALTKRVSVQLGETLAALHQIPVRNCGRPCSINEDVVVGEKIDPFEGVMQRFENPLPETWEESFRHPILATLPDLRGGILDCLREVSHRVRDQQYVLCHGDLHERQLICERDDLVALIDFGDATVLDRHWDLGSALYFHGEQVFSALFASYLSNSDGSQSCSKLAVSFSVAIAMHHASRSRLLDKQHRFAVATHHIRRVI